MKREDMFGNIEILLFDILEELKKLNQNNEIKTIEIENIVVPSSVPCKYCNGTHSNRQQMAACAKKKKKEGKK